jgi:hypothetical protein
MIHPDTHFGLVNEHIGLGVFSTKLIPQVTITYALDKLETVVPPKQPLLEFISRRDQKSFSRYLPIGNGYRSVSRLEFTPKKTKARRRVYEWEKMKVGSNQFLDEH